MMENNRQQNIPLDGDVSFTFYEFIDLRNLLADHCGKLFLSQSSFCELLLEDFSWVLVFHYCSYAEINNYIILWISELSLYIFFFFWIKLFSLILRNSEFSLLKPIYLILFHHCFTVFVNFFCFFDSYFDFFDLLHYFIFFLFSFVSLILWNSEYFVRHISYLFYIFSLEFGILFTIYINKWIHKKIFFSYKYI